MPSDQFPKKLEEKEKKLATIDIKLFRKGIGYIIDNIKEENIKGTMYDLTRIKNLDDLTTEDAYMWDRVNKLKSISEEDQKEFIEYFENAENFDSPSRISFVNAVNQKYTFLNNQIQTKQLKNFKKNKTRKL